MTVPTLASHPGTSATERAHTRWGMNAEADEAEWRRSFNEALRRLEASTASTVVTDAPAVSEDRDWSYWRNRRDDNLRRQNARLIRQIESIRRKNQRCRK